MNQKGVATLAAKLGRILVVNTTQRAKELHERKPSFLWKRKMYPPVNNLQAGTRRN
jgi:hypothetical protein